MEPSWVALIGHVSPHTKIHKHEDYSEESLRTGSAAPQCWVLFKANERQLHVVHEQETAFGNTIMNLKMININMAPWIG